MWNSMSYESFEQSLHKILSDPNFIPPECLLDLNLKGSFESLLESCGRRMCVKFSVGEVKLVLPVYETAYPDDDFPRKAILIAERWLVDPQTPISTDKIERAMATRAADVAYAANIIYYVISSTYYGFHVINSTYWVRKADPDIAYEDQLRRLFIIMGKHEFSISSS